MSNQQHFENKSATRAVSVILVLVGVLMSNTVQSQSYSPHVLSGKLQRKFEISMFSVVLNRASLETLCLTHKQLRALDELVEQYSDSVRALDMDTLGNTQYKEIERRLRKQTVQSVFDELLPIQILQLNRLSAQLITNQHSYRNKFPGSFFLGSSFAHQLLRLDKKQVGKVKKLESNYIEEVAVHNVRFVEEYQVLRTKLNKSIGAELNSEQRSIYNDYVGDRFAEIENKTADAKKRFSRGLRSQLEKQIYRATDQGFSITREIVGFSAQENAYKLIFERRFQREMQLSTSQKNELQKLEESFVDLSKDIVALESTKPGSLRDRLTDKITHDREARRLGARNSALRIRKKNKSFEVLLPHQIERAEQIAVQTFMNDHFVHNQIQIDELLKRLDLSEQQINRVSDVLGDFEKQLFDMYRTINSEISDRADNANSNAYNCLSSEQKESYVIYFPSPGGG